MAVCPTPYKQAHAAPASAKAHLRGLRAAGGSPDLRIYRCTCGALHVGHSQLALRRRIRRALRARYL